MSEIHTHAIDDHHVTRCLHDHAHGKNPLGDIGMKFEVPESTPQELSLEQRLEMLLADLKDTHIGKSFRGFGTGDNSLSDSSGQGSGSSVLFTPLAEMGTEQENTHERTPHYALVTSLPVQSHERASMLRRSGGSLGQDEASARRDTTLSNKNEDENKRQTHSPSGKTPKKRITGWVSMETDELKIESDCETHNLPITPTLETLLTGCYNARGDFASNIQRNGTSMDRKG